MNPNKTNSKYVEDLKHPNTEKKEKTVENDLFSSITFQKTKQSNEKRTRISLSRKTDTVDRKDPTVEKVEVQIIYTPFFFWVSYMVTQ